MVIKHYRKEDIDELLSNAIFMREKLKESREAMQNMPIVMPYDNGGGQKGIRQNPAYPAYEKLMKTYLDTLAVIREITAAGIHKEETHTAIVGNSKWAQIQKSWKRSEAQDEESAS